MRTKIVHTELAWGTGTNLPIPVTCCRDVLFLCRSSRHRGTELSLGRLAGTPHGRAAHLDQGPPQPEAPDWACGGCWGLPEGTVAHGTEPGQQGQSARGLGLRRLWWKPALPFTQVSVHSCSHELCRVCSCPSPPSSTSRDTTPVVKAAVVGHLPRRSADTTNPGILPRELAVRHLPAQHCPPPPPCPALHGITD